MAAIKPEMEARRHEVLESLMDTASRLGRDFGMPQEVADQLGSNIADWFAETHGGTNLVIPMDYHFHRSKRDFEMYNKFNGHNYERLAKEFGIHERSVRRILDRIHKQVIKNAQADMFN